MRQLAIYPGTFDPVTNGHIDLIRRAHEIFHDVIVAVAHNPQKKPLFTINERVKMLEKATVGMRGVRIMHFDGLVVDFAHKMKAKVLVRGVLMLSDFEYEFQMALTNRKLAGDIETIFLMPHESYSYLTARLIKEAAGLGADISDLVPDFVAGQLRKKLRGKR